MQRSGTIMPPVMVNAVAGAYVLRDGHHRVEAARLAGYSHVPALLVSE